MTADLGRERELERWIAWIRGVAVVLAVAQVAFSADYPSGYEAWAWITTGVFAVGALVLYLLSHRGWSSRGQLWLGLGATAFDFGVVSAYVLIYSFERSGPIRQLLFLPLIEAAVRYGIPGALVLTAASAPVLAVYERLRERHFSISGYRLDYVTLQLGIELLMGLIVGWLVLRLERQSKVAESRAAEAERLRDQLGRRADVLEAANRCARALSSSLELDQAFEAFIREVRGLMPFDRIAIVLSEGGIAQVMAVAGAGSTEVLPAGSSQPVRGSLLEEVLRTNQTVYRRDLTGADYPEEDELLALGLHCRLAAPLLQGARDRDAVVRPA